MTDSRHLARLLGPSLIAIAVSEWINLRVLMDTPTAVSVIYLNGTLLFIAGLSIVRAHNRWTAGWPVLVTLTGWAAIVAGLIRMMAPASGKPSAGHAAEVVAMLIALLAIGTVLTFKAYARERRIATRLPITPSERGL